MLRATHRVMHDAMGKKQSLEKDILKSRIVTTFVAMDSYHQQLHHEAQESFTSSSLSLLLRCSELRVKNSEQKLATKSCKSTSHEVISPQEKSIPNIC